MTAIVPADVNAALVRGVDNPNHKSALRQFQRWLGARAWYTASGELAAYRNHLVARGLKPTAVNKHLEAISLRYRALLKDSAVRSELYAMLDASMSLADKAVVINELALRITSEVTADGLRLPVPTITQLTDDKLIYLTADECAVFIETPADNMPTQEHYALHCAVRACLILYGLRIEELCALTVGDLRATVNGLPGVNVADGKGNKQRFVYRLPELAGWHWYVDEYLRAFDIQSGAAFRAFNRRNPPAPKTTAIDKRTAQLIVEKTPLPRGGYPTAHMLRRWHARIAHKLGYSDGFVQQQLGHSDPKLTRNVYIRPEDDRALAIMARWNAD